MNRFQYVPLFALSLIVSVTFVANSPAEEPKLPDGFQLLYQQDFSKPDSVKDFIFSDPAAWRLGQEGERHFLEQFQKSDYEYKVRSPFNIALVDRLELTSFVLEAEVQQTSREYGHRDVCLFFSFADPTHFYYNHIATKADDHANNVFIVNDAPRTKMADKTTAGYDWATHTWHHVRMVRDAENNRYEVYLNHAQDPLMVASPTEFKSGRVGFGTFDDTMRVTNIKVWGPGKKEVSAKFFKSK